MIAVLIGVFFAKLLSIAGIGGLIAGLLTRNILVALSLGLALGVVDTLLLASMRYTGVSPLSWIMAIFVAMLMATVGWFLRTHINTKPKDQT
jgi:hypothetical protein